MEEKVIATIPDRDVDGAVYEIECEEFLDEDDEESESW